MFNSDYILKKIEKYSKLQIEVCGLILEKNQLFPNDTKLQEQFFLSQDWIIRSCENTNYCDAVNILTGEKIGWFRNSENIIHLWSFFLWLMNVKNEKELKKRKLDFYEIIEMLNEKNEIELNYPQSGDKQPGIVIKTSSDK